MRRTQEYSRLKRVIRHALWKNVLSLRGRLLQLILLSTLPALLFAVLLAQKERDAQLKRAQDDISTYAEIILRQHTYQLSSMKALLKQIGDLIPVESTTVNHSSDFFKALLETHPELLNIGILNSHGEVLMSAFPFQEGTSLKNNRAFQKAVNSTSVERGHYIIGPVVKAPLLNLAYALRDKNNEIKNVLFSALNLEWPREIIEQLDLPKDYVIFILNRTGRLLVEIGKEVSLPRQNKRIFFPQLLSKKKGMPVQLKVHGGQYYFSSAGDKVAGLVVAIGFPFKKVVLDANESFLRSLANLSLIGILTIVLVLFVTEISILRIIRNLLSMTRRIGEGDLSSRTQVDQGYGELYELAQEFNSMADSLQGRHQELSLLKDELKALSHHLQLSREDEAHKIARELHDEFGQLLTAIKMDLIHYDIPTNSEINGKIDQAIKTLRKICTELRPGVLDRLGPWAAIEWLIQEYEDRSQIAVNLNNSIRGIISHDRISTTIFRVVQESLNNIVKHSEATTVNIDLSYDNGEIHIMVEDDGVGFHQDEALTKQSFGILGMRERISLLNGRFEIKSSPGKGTVISAHIPYPKDHL